MADCRHRQISSPADDTCWVHFGINRKALTSTEECALLLYSRESTLRSARTASKPARQHDTCALTTSNRSSSSLPHLLSVSINYEAWSPGEQSRKRRHPSPSPRPRRPCANLELCPWHGILRSPYGRDQANYLNNPPNPAAVPEAVLRIGPGGVVRSTHVSGFL